MTGFGLYQFLIHAACHRWAAVFSPSIFARQFEVPGFTLLRAVNDGVTAGMSIWYEQGNVAYLHLSAFDATGYKWGGASYALLWTAWEWFAPRVRWLALGAGSGSIARDDGLSWFKSGWATARGQPIFAGACSIENGTKHSSATKRLQARAIFLRIVGMNSVRSPRVHDENHANGQAQETHGRGNCRFRFAMKVYGFGDRVHFDGQVRIENACIPPKAMPDAP